MLKKFAHHGLLLLVFLLPLQTRWIAGQRIINGNPNEFLTVSVYGIDIALIIFILCKLYLTYADDNLKFKIINLKLISNFKLQISNSIVSSAAGLILWSAASVLWSVDKTLAVQHTAWLVLGAGSAWLVAAHADKTLLVFWFVMGLMVNAWLGIWQFVTQNTFASKWLGLATHDPMLGGASIVEFYAGDGSPIRWLRAYGSFDHPNVFGVVMMAGILLVIWEIARMNRENRNERDALNAYRNKIGISGNRVRIKLIYVLYCMALISMSVGLFASLSRSAWLGLVLGAACFAFLVLRSTLRNRLRNTVRSVAIVVIVFAIMTAIYPAQFAMRSGGDGRLEAKSINERMIYFEQGKNIIEENLLLGVGTGNYVKALYEKKPSNPAWTYQPVHNVFMLVWAELGIFGMLMMAAVFVGLFSYAWQARNIFSIALLASLAPTMFLDHWLWSLHFGILFFGMIIVIAFTYKESPID